MHIQYNQMIRCHIKRSLEINDHLPYRMVVKRTCVLSRKVDISYVCLLLLYTYNTNSGWQVITDHLQAVHEVKQTFQQLLVTFYYNKCTSIMCIGYLKIKHKKISL